MNGTGLYHPADPKPNCPLAVRGSVWILPKINTKYIGIICSIVLSILGLSSRLCYRLTGNDSWLNLLSMADKSGNAAGTAAPGTKPSVAAPAAPAKSAPADPGSPPASGGPSSLPAAQGAGAAADSSPVASPAPVVAKGPRASTGIPGVHVDPAGDGEFGGEEEPVVTGLQRAVKEAAESEEGEAKAAAEAAAPPAATPAPEAPAPTKPKFKMGDVEFDSEDVAVHTYKSLRGQAAAVAQRHRDLTTQQEAFIAALGQAGMALDGEGKVVRASQAPTSPAPASTSAPQKQGQPTASSDAPVDLGTDEGVRTFLDSALNWKQLPNLIKTYEDQHGLTLGPAIAMRLVMETVIPKLWEKVAGHTDKALQPLHNVIGAQQSAHAVQQLFHGMGEYVYPDGSPAYPELLDAEKAPQVHQVWMDLGEEGVPLKTLMSPKGIQMAISLYRDLMGIKGRHAASQGQPVAPQQAPPAAHPGSNVDQATQAVRAVMQSIEAARGAVSPDLSSGEGQPFRPAGEAGDRAEQIRAAIRGSRGKEVIPGVRFS